MNAFGAAWDEWRLAARLARRELRGGIKGAGTALLGLAIGVAAIAAVGSLARAIDDGIKADSRAILGGDVEIAQRYDAPQGAARMRFSASGRVSEAVEMRAMARAEGAQALVELKAVDAAYPLIGRVTLSPALALGEALAGTNGVPGAVAEPGALARLGARLGQIVRVGEAQFVLMAEIVREPDRVTAGFTLGPRLMIGLDALAATELVQPGSIAEFRTRILLGPEAEAKSWLAALKRDFPDAGWRARDSDAAAPRIKEMVERLRVYLTLVGLAALLIGGVGIANAVRAYLDRRIATIATLKCLGATNGLVFRVYLVQVAALAVAGIAGGLVLGAATPAAFGSLIAEFLPVRPIWSIYPDVLVLAASYGALTALVFALWPLLQTRAVSPAALFRAAIGRISGTIGARGMIAVAAASAALIAFAITFVGQRELALWFAFGAACAFAAFRAAAWAIARLAARAGQMPALVAGRPTLRLALANLHRPGAATPSVVLSLGIGLTVLVAVVLLQGNLARQIGQDMPAHAPAFFFIDIQPHQVADFAALAAAMPGVGAIDSVPHLRGRITRIKGVPADEAKVKPEVAWILRGDRGITYAATPPRGAEIVAGEWWARDYRADGATGASKSALVSFDEAAADGLGLKLGDSLTVNVLGREVELRIANLRRIAWQTLGINFTLIVSPGVFESAPQTHIATVSAEDGALDGLEKSAAERFPNVSAIRVKAALETVNQTIGQMGNAVRMAAAVTLLVGVLVLAGAVAAGRKGRLYDAVILKVLGAARTDLLRAYAIEYGLLGVATSALAAAFGTLAGWVLVTQIVRTGWAFMPGLVAATVGLASLAILAFGFLGSWRALGRSGSGLLRNE